MVRTETDGSLSRRALLFGTAGAVGAVAATGATAAQDGEGTVVDMTDDLVFAPEEVTVAPGTTVVWENVGQVGHSVTAYEDEIPEEAEFFASGDLESEEAARSAYPAEGDVAGGESYEHTFDVEGTYEYFCIPHESVGMLGTVVVSAGGGEGGGEGGGGGLPSVGDDAVVLGLGTVLSMLLVVGFAFFLLKYGGDYGE